MGTYTSKFTGQEIDELLDKVKNEQPTGGEVFLKKKIQSINGTVSFDMDILANNGFEVSGNNRVVLKAGKTYLIRYCIEYLGTNSTKAQLGVGTNFEGYDGEDKFTYLYSENFDTNWGNSGAKEIVVTPSEDTELTFVTSQYSSSISMAYVKCFVQEF
jgi:hypothetical protein